MNTKTAPTQETWTPIDSDQALAQGWDLFELDAAGTRKQIQKDDESDVFADDLAAIAFVQERAAAGDELAAKALRIDEGVTDKDKHEIEARRAAK